MTHQSLVSRIVRAERPSRVSPRTMDCIIEHLIQCIYEFIVNVVVTLLFSVNS